LYKDALSSGEVAFLELGALSIEHGKYFYIGPEKDRDLLNGIGLKEADSAKDAAFAVTTGFDNDDSTLDEKMPQIQEALGRKLKLYCVNPDLIVVRQDGSKMLCAGVIGEYYKEQGGDVEFIGKPFPKVYEYTFRKFSPSIPKSRIVAIGDGFETDIVGAHKAGIDSILCMGGILSVTKTPVSELVEKFGCEPTGTLPRFI
jgi:HAD superfamily hydrolase (TIGR01459 family)